MKKKELNFRIHDPNPPEEAAEFLYRLFLEVNAPLVERIVREDMEQRAGREPETSPAA